jgi:O-antigen ligase
MASLFILFRARYGWKKTLPLAALALPALLVVFGGRQADISLDKADTMQQRIQLWAQGFTALSQTPLFGIGAGHYEDMTDEHLVAHNTYVHVLVELGLVGGPFFLGAVYFGVWPLERLTRQPRAIGNPDLRFLLPFMTALIGGFAVGLLSLSRPYAASTYIVLGLSAAYLRQVAGSCTLPDVRCSSRFMLHLGVVSAVVAASLYAGTRLLVQW